MENIQQGVQWLWSHKYIIMVHLIAIDHVVLIGFQAIGNIKATSILQKIYTFLSAIVVATGQVIAKNKTASMILIACLISGSAHADIFNPIGPGTQGKYKSFLASVNGPSGSTLADISTILNYLGTTAGEGYNIRLGQWDTPVGATLITLPAYYMSIGAETLIPGSGGSFIDGWAETNSLNWGAFLDKYTSISTIPVIQYLSQAFAGVDFGEEKNNKGNYQFAPVIRVGIKISFGPQS